MKRRQAAAAAGIDDHHDDNIARMANDNIILSLLSNDQSNLIVAMSPSLLSSSENSLQVLVGCVMVAHSPHYIIGYLIHFCYLLCSHLLTFPLLPFACEPPQR